MMKGSFIGGRIIGSAIIILNFLPKTKAKINGAIQKLAKTLL